MERVPISLFFPVYKDEATVAVMVEKALALLQKPIDREFGGS